MVCYSSFLIFSAEAPARLEAGRDLDERRFAFLPGIAFYPAQFRIEQLVEPSVLFSFLDNLDGSADQQKFLSSSRVNENRCMRVLSEILQLPGPIVRHNIRGVLVPDIRYRDNVRLTFLRCCCKSAQFIALQEIDLFR